MAFGTLLADATVVLLHLMLLPAVTATPDLPYLSRFWPHLSLYIGPAPTRNIHGGQNFTYCCAKALDQYLGDNTTTSIHVADNFSVRQQFPCGATYQNNPAGAPTVKISYNWCSTNCPGWSVSESSKLSQWLQPFVGFILPAIVFALNVPRRRKLQLPDWVFPRDITDPLRLLGAIFCAVVAASIVAIDTIVWLLAVFALAGPLLFSGLYEAWIDKRIVDYLLEKIDNNHLPLQLRVRILVAILVGNLDQDTAWEPAMSVASTLEHTVALPEDPKLREEELQRRTRCMHDVQTRLRSMIACQYSFGSTIGAPIVFYIGSFIYAISETKSQLGDNDTSHALAFGMWWMSIPHIAIVSGCLLAGNNPNTLEAIAPRPDAEPRTHRDNWVRAHTKFLREQGNRMFGSTYDAKYKPAWMWDRGRSKRSWLLRVCREYAAEDRDHLKKLTSRLEMGPGDWTVVSTLAFLLFFIPSLFGFLTSFYTPQIGLACRSLTFLVYACSQTWLLLLWIWNFTGRDNDWRQRPRDEEDLKISAEMTVLNGVSSPDSTVPDAAESSKNEDTITTIPLTANPGPQRRESHSPAPPYTDNQQASVPPNTVPESAPSTQPVRQPSWFLRLAKARWFPSRAEHLLPNQTHASRLGFTLFWFFMGVGFLGAIFSSIAGTMMQIMGVYRNCLCQINVQSWLHRRDEAVLEISSNSALDIRQAQHFWIPMGGAAAGFLGVVAYVAWWYQRRLRMLFGDLVGMVGTNLPENSAGGGGVRMVDGSVAVA